ncbi:ZZ-type zinc finger-containing protein 3 [Chytridiales sp. JEL 0842]|nr:ZZ-type zinc finger-containing protein 3 [Chytridiales sp. JEL 0842]
MGDPTGNDATPMDVVEEPNPLQQQQQEQQQQQQQQQLTKQPNGTAPTSTDAEALTPEQERILAQNRLYQHVLATMNVLRNQLAQAEMDVNKLIEIKEHALEHPAEFVSNLVAKTGPRLPKLQRVVAIPDIDFAKLQDAGKPSGLTSADVTGPITRNRLNLFKNVKYDAFPAIQGPQTPQETYATPSVGTPVGTDTMMEEAEIHSQPHTIPNKIIHPSAPEPASASKFKPKPSRRPEPWSEEENRQLMALLDVYPMEATIASRAAKIAKDLKSRTAVQVANRLQKLFANSDTPGRTKKLGLHTRLQNGSRRTSGVQYLGATNVQMSEDESVSEGDVAIDEKLKGTPEYQELKRLKRLARRKKKEQAQVAVEGLEAVHQSINCDSCNLSPIVGVTSMEMSRLSVGKAD